MTGVDLTELDSICDILDELDYFQVLKIEKMASAADIKKAFYRESRAYHPDRFFQIPDPALKEKVNAIYKRITEAYYVLRDDVKRRKYLADISSPERKQKLRFSDASEAETKAAQKKEAEEQIGTTPKGRQLYATALSDMEKGSWANAERNLRSALMYERENVRYKEKLAEVLAAAKAK
jgi:curved DNA-binding protein CbpA